MDRQGRARSREACALYADLMSFEPSKLSEWQTFLAVQTGAAATLTGLVFVAASINLTKIITFPGLPSRVAESIVLFLQVFFVCSAALVPGQPTDALAIETLSVALFSWVIQAIWQIRYARMRTGHPRQWLMLRILQTQLATLPLIIGAIFLLLGWPSGIYWLVPGFTFSFIAGVANAWVLLIEIHR